jgi:hypothetical protein
MKRFLWTSSLEGLSAHIARLAFNRFNEGDSYHHTPPVCLSIITQQAKYSRFASHLQIQVAREEND